MSKNDNSAATLVTTPVGTLSFPHIDSPQIPDADELANGKKPTYSAAIIFNKAADLKAMKAAALAAAVAFFGEKEGAKMVTMGGKGSTFRTDMRDGYPEDAVAYVNARSTTQPGTVYLWAAPGTTKPAEIPQDKIREELYPGAQVRAVLRAYGYNKKGNRGIAWALNHIQKVADGTRLDNRQKATDAFEADLSVTPSDLSALGLSN